MSQRHAQKPRFAGGARSDRRGGAQQKPIPALRQPILVRLAALFLLPVAHFGPTEAQIWIFCLHGPRTATAIVDRAAVRTAGPAVQLPQPGSEQPSAQQAAPGEPGTALISKTA